MKNYAVPLSLVGAILILVGGIGYIIAPETGSGGLFNIAIGIFLVVVAGVLDKAMFLQYGRWLNAFWGGIMVFGIVVMVNFLSDRYSERLDLTEGKLHSLSDLTTQTLQNLDRDVEALAFVEGGENQDLELLLAEYANNATRFNYEMIDPDRQPGLTKENGITRYNTLLLKANGKEQQITELEEREITNSLLKVVRDRREKVYFSVGHGERSLSDDPDGLNLLKDRLKNIDYLVQDSLLLARENRVPEDCAVLVIAGPRNSFFSNEIGHIREYLKNGGAVLAMLDPLYDSGLESLFSEWGVVIGNDFVIDTSGIGSLFGLDFTTPVSQSYGDHPIAQKHGGLMTFYQLGRSVRFDNKLDSHISGTELSLTSESGWAEKDLSVLTGEGDQTVKLDEGIDIPGPVALGVAVEGETGRLVVFGDSDFVTNQFFDYQGNGDLALNSVSWLAEDEGLISIRPRKAGHNPIALTESQGEWVFWLSVVLYPLTISALGFMVVSRKGRWSVKELVGAGIGVVLSLGIVTLLNFIGDRYNFREDMTAENLYTLSGKTTNLLNSMEDRGYYVNVKTFMSDMEGVRFQDLMKEYKHVSGNFDYELIDPQKNSLQVKQNNIRERGASIVELRGEGNVRTERITLQNEQTLSNAISKALNAKEMKAYFTTGHDESALDQVDGKGYSKFKSRLLERNFEIIDDLDLGDGVPKDATLLVALGPKQPFTPAESDSLANYLAAGGCGLFLLDPGQLTGLENLLASYSINIGQDFVVDLSGLGQLFGGTDVSVPVVVNYGDHPISERINRGTMSFFPLARSIQIASHRLKNPEITKLAMTHERSWGESDLGPIMGAGGQVEYDPELDTIGPISIAVAVKADVDTVIAKEGSTKLVVFGDSDFASNEYFDQQANGQLIKSSVEWLAEGDDRLEIEDRIPSYNPINLIGNQGDVILWISVFVLPFAVALSGLIMVLKRGYQSYVDGCLAWLMYTFAANGIFLLITASVAMSESDMVSGQFQVLTGILCLGVSFGVYRRHAMVWVPAIVVSIFCSVGAFFVLSDETLQLLYVAIFVVNIAVLTWIRKAFVEEKKGI